jgi:hypothetical protein
MSKHTNFELHFASMYFCDFFIFAIYVILQIIGVISRMYFRFLSAIRFFAIQNKINYISTRLDKVFKNFDVLKQEPLSGKTNFDADNLIKSRKRFYFI